jgi:predicted transcriptional regulator
MRTATIPSLRVDPDLRRAAEEVLQEGETLSALLESALRAKIEQRRSQHAFIAKGLAAREQARGRDAYVGADEVVHRLQQRLAKAKTSGA